MAGKVESYLTQLAFNATTGEAIGEGDLVGISSAGTAWKADADATHGASATNRAVGVAVKAAASGAKVTIAPIAVVSSLTGSGNALVAGDVAYLAVTAGLFNGAKTTTNTYVVQPVGIAVTTSKVFVNVGFPLKAQTSGNSVATFL